MSTIPANQPAPAADLPAPEPRGRDRILTQARALFLARGYLDVSMREIAAAADVRKATIYHHFRDKEALFPDIVLAEIATSQQRMSETIAAMNGFSETLEALATQQFTNARSSAWRLARDYREHVPEHAHTEVHAALGLMFGIYRRVFQNAYDAGEIAGIDPDFAASSFYQTIIAWSWGFPIDIGLADKSPQELAHLAVQMLLNGIRA
jgi:TetR/AcrR family transcriptional regulator